MDMPIEDTQEPEIEQPEIEPLAELTPIQRLAMIAELADIETETEPETDVPEPDAAVLPDDEMKIGAMISRVNAAKIQAAHDSLTQLGAACGKKAVDIDVMTDGGTLKALGNGRVGGYLVRYSTANDPDLTGDYFTAKTVISSPSALPLLYNHGMDKVIGKRIIGKATLTPDAVGVWCESQLNMRDEYEKAIYKLAEAGKLGYSSGALSHMVEREPVKNGVFHIKSWFIGEASLTPTPAEPRNGITPLKSLLSASGVADAVQTKTFEKETEMATEIEIKAIVDAALAEQASAVKAAADRAAELKAAQDEGYRLAVDELKGKIKTVKHVAKAGDDNDGVQAFKAWLTTGQDNGSLISPPSGLGSVKAAFNQTTGASGGYLIPDPLYNQIIAKRNIASWVRQAPVQRFGTSSDHLLIPVEDTSHTAFVVTNEAAAYNENEGTVAQVDLALLKYTKLVKASEEFMLDENSNFDGWLTEALARAEAVTENTVATTAILASATAGTAAANATSLTLAEVYRLIGTLGGGYNVQGQTGFLMKNATKWYLKGVEATNYQMADILAGNPVFISDDMPAMTNGLRSTLYGNFNYFALLERPGMLVQRNPYLYMANGQIGIFANIYRGFAVLQAEAFYTMAQG